jgi:hypothetical protein
MMFGMPTPDQVSQWIRRNEAARRADLAADRAKTMSERLAEAARLSRVATGMRDHVERAPRARG